MAVHTTTFETLTLPRGTELQTKDAIRQLEAMVASSSIKIVDIRRNRDELIVTFRRLN